MIAFDCLQYDGGSDPLDGPSSISTTPWLSEQRRDFSQLSKLLCSLLPPDIGLCHRVLDYKVIPTY